MKLLFIFINVLFSIKNDSASLEDNMNLERRSSGLYNVMLKPYVLELLNSKAIAALKTFESKERHAGQICIFL